MLALAQDIQSDVSGLMRTFSCDRDRLRSALEVVDYQQQVMGKGAGSGGTLGGTLGGSSSSGPGSNVAIIAALRQSLNSAVQQVDFQHLSKL